MAEDTTLLHHRRFEYCTTRPKYRQGRQLKAVKVYTIANESKHLLVFGVPIVNLQSELKRSLQRYGQVECVQCVTPEMSKKMKLEIFTDVFYVKFSKLEEARRAKRFLDAKQFYGGILHLSYAPERESEEELRMKFIQRKKEVIYCLKKNDQSIK